MLRRVTLYMETKIEENVCQQNCITQNPSETPPTPEKPLNTIPRIENESVRSDGNGIKEVRTKRCSKCKGIYSITEYRKATKNKDGLYCWCRGCSRIWGRKYKHSEKAKEYRKNNPAKINKWAREWRGKNKKRSSEIKENSRKKNREKYNARIRERRKEDINYRLKCIASKAVWYYLKIQNSQKDNKTWSKLPYTPQELKEHLESLWEPWMNWQNHGNYNPSYQTWQIDHIIPQHDLPYDSLDHPNFQICWALQNLRPLETIENSSRFSREKNKNVNLPINE